MTDKRCAERRALAVAARLIWKDQRGRDKIASVVTRDVSDLGIFIESPKPLSIPLYRLVHFQLEPGVRTSPDLPRFLRQGRVLTAVYRIATPKNDERHGMALRLIMEPGHATVAAAAEYSIPRARHFGVYRASS
jgi:hypothetical protein